MMLYMGWVMQPRPVASQVSTTYSARNANAEPPTYQSTIIYSELSLQRQHLFPKMLPLKINLLFQRILNGQNDM